MAGDWIKVRTGIHEAPKVLQIASILERDPLHVVGMLVRLWTWADQNSLNGNALSVTHVTLDALLKCDGFTDALRKVGWIDGEDWDLHLPRFDEHNGQTAKARALTSNRVAKRRCNARSVTEALPEKRREEKSISTSSKSPLVFPAELDADDFRTAWSEWQTYRRERKLPAWKPRTVEAQLKNLAEMGRPGAVESIKQSIANGWNGLFPPKNEINRKHNAASSSRGFSESDDYAGIGLVP